MMRGAGYFVVFSLAGMALCAYAVVHAPSSGPLVFSNATAGPLTFAGLLVGMAVGIHAGMNAPPPKRLPGE